MGLNCEFKLVCLRVDTSNLKCVFIRVYVCLCVCKRDIGVSGESCPPLIHALLLSLLQHGCGKGKPGADQQTGGGGCTHTHSLSL